MHPTAGAVVEELACVDHARFWTPRLNVSDRCQSGFPHSQPPLFTHSLPRRANKTYFRPWESIHEGNPQQILDRREAVTLPPLLIMQGALDDNVLPAIQEKFAASYRAAGGDCQLHIFEECEHEWVAKPGPQTDRAHEMVKGFIARQVTAAHRR
jgi:alpha-beta hydrolase superfamily lysophospholipase